MITPFIPHTGVPQRKQPYGPRVCHLIDMVGLNPSNVKNWYLVRIDWRIFPFSGLSILTDTRSIEVHKERGQRHMSNILQVRDTGRDSFTETHPEDIPLL